MTLWKWKCYEYICIYALQVLKTNLDNLEPSELHPILLVFDGLTTLPSTEVGDDSSRALLKLMSSPHVHCVVLYKYYYHLPDKLIQTVSQDLQRRCDAYTIEPLSVIESTQRIVYTLQREVDLAPYNSDQQNLEKLAELTSGSPILVDIISRLILKKDLASVSTWESITISNIINSFVLTAEEKMLLNCLSIFGCCPIPVYPITDALSSTICSGQPHLTPSLLRNLISKSLILTYPSPVVFHPSLDSISVREEFVYLPQDVGNYLWKSLEDHDKAVALSITHCTLASLSTVSRSCCSKFLLCLVKRLKNTMEPLMGEECFMETSRLHLKAST